MLADSAVGTCQGYIMQSSCENITNSIRKATVVVVVWTKVSVGLCARPSPSERTGTETRGIPQSDLRTEACDNALGDYRASANSVAAISHTTLV